MSDVVNTVRLEQFQKKHKEWVAWLHGDDPHSIWKQITSLLWDYALFQTINELCKEAAQNPAKDVGFNVPVMRLLEAGFAVTQVTGIRRLTEKQPKDSTKRVIALRALVDDIRANRELLTREIYLACRELPFDPAPAKQRFFDGLVSSGEKFSYVGVATTGPAAWRDSELAHERFDTLSEMSPASRSREDLVSSKWFDPLNAKIKSCEDVCVFTDKFIAHAADPISRSAMTQTQTGVTLNQLKACHQAIIGVTGFVSGHILQDSLCASVPVPQFDLLDNLDKRWIGDGGLEKARGFWERHVDEIEKWSEVSFLDSLTT